jgi:hypothetical protein
MEMPRIDSTPKRSHEGGGAIKLDIFHPEWMRVVLVRLET